MKKAILTAALALSPGVFPAQGCNYADRDLDPTLDGFFVEGGVQTPRATQMADAQAASGARADGMLHDRHFDGRRLNSLGEQKLSLMLCDDDAPDPMVVYLDGDPKDPRAAHRRDSIALFLKHRGLKDDQVTVMMGDNPAARSPAAGHILRQSRTESGEAISGGPGQDVARSDRDSVGGFYTPTGGGGGFGSTKQ